MPAESFPKKLPVLWVVGCIAAALYSQQQDIPARLSVPIAVAFLLEISLYAEVRRLSKWAAPLVWVSALAPYLIEAASTGTMHWQTAATLAGLSAVAVFWFPVLGAGAAPELLFLAFMGGVYIAKPFRWIYPDPFEDLRIDVLGQLMWIRVGIASVLRYRGDEGIGFSFLPEKRDWAIGFRYFLYFLPVGVVLLMWLRSQNLGLANGWWWKAPGTFLAVLWTVALGEEFFFRGLLQQRLMQWWGTAAAIVAASALFGLAHIRFSNQFPNWPMVAIGVTLGVACGMAYAQTGSIRTSMVTHAFVVAVWRTFFP